MNLESGCSLLVSVEDDEEIRNASVVEELGNTGESKVHNNGSCEVQNNDYNELRSDAKEKGTEASESVSSPPVEMKSELSPSPTMIRKGYGLKKWRRIKRDVSKVGDSSVETGKIVMQELSNSVVHPSKRTQVYAERQQKSEGSVSSTNPVVGSLDIFSLLGDPGLVMGPLVDAGTDSENSEDRSGKSSTAASVPKIKYELPVAVGFPHDKSRMRSLSGKNLAQSVQRNQQGKGWIEAIKKARGERVKIEKENSHSSMESDSCSSNFVFMQDPYETSNGIRRERPAHENGDEVQGVERKVSDGLPGGYGRESEGRYEDISPEEVVADLSWETQREKSENHGSSLDLDPLVESIFVLQTAQEALEKEVLQFKEISKDASVDDLVSDTQPEFTDVGQKFQQTSSEQLRSGKGVPNFFRAVQSEMVEIVNRDVERELEDLFKQRIEAEVQYLAISRTVQKLRVAAVDQITCLEEHRAPASEQTQILYKHGGKAIMLMKEAEKLENCCEDIASADEILKLQKRVCKYTSYFSVQLLSLLVILGFFLFQLSPNYVEVVPT